MATYPPQPPVPPKPLEEMQVPDMGQLDSPPEPISPETAVPHPLVDLNQVGDFRGTTPSKWTGGGRATTVEPWDDESYTTSFIEWWKKQEAYYLKLLTPTFVKCQDYWKRYLLKREDWRDEDTQWRAFVTDPSPNQVIETIVQTTVEIFDNANPLIQGDNFGPGASEDAKSIENIVDMVLRKNKFPAFIDDLARHVLVQGFQPVKIVQHKKTTVIRREVGEEDWQDFEKAVRQGQMAVGVPAPTGDPNAFDVWRQQVLDTTGVTVPEIPVPGPQEQVLYQGPTLYRPSIYTLRFDPAIVDWQLQPIIMQRFVVPRKFIEERTDWTGVAGYPDVNKPWCKLDPTLPFIGRLVALALENTADTKPSEWEKDLNRLLNYDTDDSDPAVEDPVVLHENWLPAGDTVRKVFMLNHSQPINKGARFLEYDHGQAPWINLRNIPIEGSLGMSELELSWSNFEEHEKLRELFLDSVAIRGIPMIYNLLNSGLDDEEVQGWAPGKTFRPVRADSFGMVKLGDNSSSTSDILRGLQMLRAEYDDTHNTWGQVRGQEASVGRVTADESRNRLSQGLLRQKTRVTRWSEELQGMVYQILGLLAQYVPSKDLIAVGGTNPFARLSRKDLYDSLFQSYRLRGPVEHLNKQEDIDKLFAFAKTFGPFIRPDEQRELMSQVLALMDIKDRRKIVTPAGTQATIAAFNTPPPGAVPPPQPPMGALPAGGPPGAGGPQPPPQPPPQGGPPQG